MSIAIIFAGTLKLHWDAATPSDGAVSSWASIGPDTTALVQATGSKQPVRSATSFLGHPGVTSDGNDVLACTLGTPFASGSRPYFLVVAKLNAVAANGALFKAAITPETGDQVEILIGSEGDRQFGLWRDDSSGAGDAYYSALADTLPRIFECGFTTGALRALVIDGAERDTINLSSTTRDGTPASDLNIIRVFGDTAVPAFTTEATIAEIVGLTAAPTEAQLVAARAFWRSKYTMARTIQSRTQTFDIGQLDPAIAAATEGNYVDAEVYDDRVIFAPSTSGVGHDKMIWYDTRLPFRDPDSWKVYDRTGIDPTFKMFEGSLVVDTYLYLPTNTFFLHRVDLSDSNLLSGGVPSEASFQRIDLRTVGGSGRDYIYPFYDGARYIYYPQLDYQRHTGVRMLQYDTQAGSFTAPSGYVMSPDTTTIHPLAKGFDGGCWDGRYAYFAACSYGVPTTMHGNHVRWDSQAGDFDDVDAWQHFDSATVDAGLCGFSGAVHVGDYIYYAHGESTVLLGDGYHLLRYDRRLDFTNPAAWAFYDCRNIYSRLRGFTGIFTDGRFVIWSENEGQGDPCALIFDTHAAGGFFSPASYEYVDSRWYGNGFNTNYGTAGGIAHQGFYYPAPYHRKEAIKIATAADNELIASIGDFGLVATGEVINTGELAQSIGTFGLSAEIVRRHGPIRAVTASVVRPFTGSLLVSD